MNSVTVTYEQYTEVKVTDKKWTEWQWQMDSGRCSEQCERDDEQWTVWQWQMNSEQRWLCAGRGWTRHSHSRSLTVSSSVERWLTGLGGCPLGCWRWRLLQYGIFRPVWTWFSVTMISAKLDLIDGLIYFMFDLRSLSCITATFNAVTRECFSFPIWSI